MRGRDRRELNSASPLFVPRLSRRLTRLNGDGLFVRVHRVYLLFSSDSIYETT